MKYLIVVVGPTAVGKTSLCIELAKHLNTEIISADSRQFYREMNIGTAKPSEEELEAVPHHFINSHSIQQFYTAGHYERDAIDLINELFENRDILILTGGSGLYIQAITEGMADIPQVDHKIRDELNRKHQSQGLTSLLDELKELDPLYYYEVDKANPQRVIRALEVCYGTSKQYSDFRNKQVKDRPFQILKIGLERDRQELYERINERMGEMIKSGLFEEAKQLLPHRSHYALQTVGYKEIYDHLDGEYGKDEAIRLLKRNTRRYAKRQMTWFKRVGDTQWFHPDQLKDVIQYVREVTGIRGFSE